MKTPQEIFDTVATHLLRQGKQASRGGESCSYRTDDGLKCAVGCLIPDELYDREIEGDGVDRLFRRYPMLMAWIGLDEQEHDLLRALQGTHDVSDPSRWKDQLRHDATDHRLSPAILDTLP